MTTDALRDDGVAERAELSALIRDASPAIERTALDAIRSGMRTWRRQTPTGEVIQADGELPDLIDRATPSAVRYALMTTLSAVRAAAAPPPDRDDRDDDWP